MSARPRLLVADDDAEPPSHFRRECHASLDAWFERIFIAEACGADDDAITLATAFRRAAIADIAAGAAGPAQCPLGKGPAPPRRLGSAGSAMPLPHAEMDRHPARPLHV
jgi:hypothetical protein